MYSSPIIHRLLDAGIRVTIRLNIDRHNADDLLALAEILGAEFKGEAKLNAYSHVLFEVGSEESAVQHTDAQRQELFQVRMRPQGHWTWPLGIIPMPLEPAHYLQYVMMFVIGVLAGRCGWLVRTIPGVRKVI